MSPSIPATSSPWVPLWNLNGGADLRYNGAYAPGSYTDGDIVSYNGVLYMCVRPTNKTPTVWPPGVGSNYGTTLPSSPVDGQEAILVDNVTNPSYTWRFRYNAQSTSAYKWEFIGGAPASAFNQAPNPTISSTYSTGGGPTLQLPRAGDYDVTIGFSTWLTTAGQSSFLSFDFGSGANDTDAIWQTAASATPQGPPLTRRYRKNGLGAVLLTAYYRATNTAGYGVQMASIAVTPVRVS